MKKFLWVFALLLALVLAFTACDGAPATSTTESQEGTGSTNDTTVDPCEEHTYGEWVTVEEATCAKTGLRRRTCTVCNYVKEDTTSLKLHTHQAVGKVDATCDKDGHTSGTNCSVCGYVISGCEVILAKGHKFKDGECTVCNAPSPVNDAYILLYATKKGGYLETALRNCGFGVMVNVVGGDSTTEPEFDNFDLVIFDGVEPVELPEGKSACYVNTPTLPSGLATYGASINSNTGTPLFANTYNKIGKQITNKVTVSDAVVYSVNPLTGLNSAFSPFLMAGANNAAVAGEVNGTKTIIVGFAIEESNLTLSASDLVTLVYNMVEYSMLGILPEAEACKHSQESVKGYDATCEQDGLSNGISCSKCGAVLIPQEVKPATGHKYDENGVCKNCGKEKEE